MKQHVFVSLLTAVLWGWIAAIDWHLHGFTVLTNLSVLNLILALALVVQAVWVK